MLLYCHWKTDIVRPVVCVCQQHYSKSYSWKFGRYSVTQLHVGVDFVLWDVHAFLDKYENLLYQAREKCDLHTHNRLTAVGPVLPGRPVPEETLTHLHPSWSSDILYQLPPFTTIHSILCVQFTCLTVLFNNLSLGLLWSSSWSWTLYFILHAFLHPVIIFSQHMPIPTQPVLL